MPSTIINKEIANALRSPHLDSLIFAFIDHDLPISIECHTVNNACMAFEGALFLACREVPHLNRLIVAPTNYCFSISTEYNTLNSTCMADEGVLFLACREVPHFDRRIVVPFVSGQSIAIGSYIASNDESLSIGTE